ncbi:hypothetical protein AB0A63_31630 [Lentzea sp. NPDC042327]|uniref:hypothetical protein n=1 Tax=Lentzea sp. NPDC042327 TaxID=3154801 RepID=UPI0033D27E51
MTTTTQLLGWGGYTLRASVEDTVIDFVNEFADDYDLDGLAHGFRAAINERLGGTGISLRGNEFSSTYPAREDAGELIQAAIEDVDLGALAAEHDTTAQ